MASRGGSLARIPLQDQFEQMAHFLAKYDGPKRISPTNEQKLKVTNYLAMPFVSFPIKHDALCYPAAIPHQFYALYKQGTVVT